MLGLVKPLAGFMVLAVVTGTPGFLAVQFIPVLGGYAVLNGPGYDTPLALKTIWILLAVFDLLRAVLRYTEQKTNHYIAFTLLAIVRDKVFKLLRSLCPHHLPHMYRNSYRDRNVSFHRQLSPLYGSAGGSAYIVAQPLQQRSCGYLRNAHSASGVHVPPYNGNKALYPQQKIKINIINSCGSHATNMGAAAGYSADVSSSLTEYL